ncbi:hypothetical protein D3C86_1258970 [compost metagenome]
MGVGEDVTTERRLGALGERPQGRGGLGDEDGEVSGPVRVLLALVEPRAAVLRLGLGQSAGLLADAIAPLPEGQGEEDEGEGEEDGGARVAQLLAQLVAGDG